MRSVAEHRRMAIGEDVALQNISGRPAHPPDARPVADRVTTSWESPMFVALAEEFTLPCGLSFEIASSRRR